jgi:hypothetical protein
MDAVGGGVGEHIRQGAQPHPGQFGHREAACGQQRPDLGDRAGDGGAVDPVQHRQSVVRELQAQDDQGDQHPIDEDEPVAGAGPGSAAAWVAAALVQGGLVGGGPRVGELDDQLGEVLPGQTGEDTMGEGRTGPCWLRHPRMMTVWPISCLSATSAITPSYRAPSR